jgi:hypothetical protein
MYRLFELSVRLSSCLRIASLAERSTTGLQTTAFGQLSYVERERSFRVAECHRVPRSS